MWLVRLIFFSVGAFVGVECMLVAWLECGFCIRTFHPNALWISAVCSCVIAGWFHSEHLRHRTRFPDESPFLDAASLASGGWFPFALQALLAALF